MRVLARVAARVIFSGPHRSWYPIFPAGAPPGEKGKHEVRFWIRADGRVTRIEVSPPIRDFGLPSRIHGNHVEFLCLVRRKSRDGRPIDYVYSIVVSP